MTTTTMTPFAATLCPVITAERLRDRQFPGLPVTDPSARVPIAGCYTENLRLLPEPKAPEPTLRLYIAGLLGWDAGHAVLAEGSGLARVAPAFFSTGAVGMDLLLEAVKRAGGRIKDERLAAAAVMMRNNACFDTVRSSALVDHGYLGLWRGEHIRVDPSLIDRWAGLDPYAEHRRRLAVLDIETE